MSVRFIEPIVQRRRLVLSWWGLSSTRQSALLSDCGSRIVPVSFENIQGGGSEQDCARHCNLRNKHLCGVKERFHFIPRREAKLNRGKFLPFVFSNFCRSYIWTTNLRTEEAIFACLCSRISVGIQTCWLTCVPSWLLGFSVTRGSSSRWSLLLQFLRFCYRCRPFFCISATGTQVHSLHKEKYSVCLFADTENIDAHDYTHNSPPVRKLSARLFGSLQAFWSENRSAWPRRGQFSPRVLTYAKNDETHERAQNTTHTLGMDAHVVNRWLWTWTKWDLANEAHNISRVLLTWHHLFTFHQPSRHSTDQFGRHSG